MMYTPIIHTIYNDKYNYDTICMYIALQYYREERGPNVLRSKKELKKN